MESWLPSRQSLQRSLSQPVRAVRHLQYVQRKMRRDDDFSAHLRRIILEVTYRTTILSRYRFGLIPVSSLNRRVNALWSENPQL